jgi:hypothetical protein
MWLFLFVAFFVLNPEPSQVSVVPAPRPPLIVQIVDPAWFPIPGAEVRVETVGRDAQANSCRTDGDGYAKFFVPVDADYTIKTSFAGFKNGHVKRIHLFKPIATAPSAYVQLRLEVSGSGTKVY